MSHAGAILVMRLGRLGDLILTAAATRELRRAFPDARIDFLALEPFAEVARLLPGVDRTLPFPGGGLRDAFALHRSALAGWYDYIFDLQGSVRSRLLCRLVKGGRRIRYPRDTIRRRLLVWKKRGRGRGEAVWRRYLRAVERAGVEVRFEPPRIRNVEQEGIPGAVAFAPGAGRTTKRWPPTRFTEAARLARGRLHRPIVLLGSSEEEGLLRQVAAGCGGEVTVHAGGPLAETVAYLQDAEVLVTNDSGLLHVANAVATPVVAIFGPTVPELGFPPSGERDAILAQSLRCRPCSLHGTDQCPLPDHSHRCMTEIEPEMVLEAVERIVGGPVDPNRLT